MVRDPDAEKRRDFLVNTPLRAAMLLSEALPINDATYLGVYGHAYHDPRAYFLYGCMDEVLKAATAAVRWLQFLRPSQNPVPEPPDVPAERREHMQRLVPDAVIDEQQMWGRKLHELLSDLILFGTTNGQDHYRLYLAARLLDAYLGLQQDFEEFFACRNRNADVSIRDLSQIVHTLRDNAGTSIWFLRDDAAKAKRGGHLFVSQRQRFMRAVELASPDQRITLGASYEMGYSVPSRSIHAGIGSPRRETTGEEIDKNLGHVSMLASHVVVSAYRLAGIELTGDVRLLADSLATEEAAQMLQQTHGAQHAIGDIVFVYGQDVCLVLGRSESKYGYSSYRVQYITKPMLDEVPVDEFPARYVHKLIPRARLREAMKRALGSDADAIAKVDALEEEELTRRSIETIQEWERSGVLEKMFELFRGQSEAGPRDLSQRNEVASAPANASSSPIAQEGPVTRPSPVGGVERGFVG